MRYEELVQEVKKATQSTIVSKILGHIAFQFNVEGEAEGAFYLEVTDGKINVEPYEYYDRDLIIVTSADVIMQMVKGKLQPMVAYVNGQIKVYGDANQLKALPLGGNGKTETKIEEKAEKTPDKTPDKTTEKTDVVVTEEKQKI